MRQTLVLVAESLSSVNQALPIIWLASLCKGDRSVQMRFHRCKATNKPPTYAGHVRAVELQTFTSYTSYISVPCEHLHMGLVDLQALAASRCQLTAACSRQHTICKGAVL